MRKTPLVASIKSIFCEPGFHKHNQQDLLELFKPIMDIEADRKFRLLFGKIKNSSHTKSRYSVLPINYFDSSSEGESTKAPIASLSTGDRQKIYESASKELIQKIVSKAQIDINQEINNIVTVSCTGYQTPGIDFELLQALRDKFGITNNPFRYHVGAMGCYAGIVGLRLASNLPGKTLLLCLELCSLHFQSELNFSFLSSNSLFADGAALIEVEQNLNSGFQILSHGTSQIPNTLDQMSWLLRDKGFEMGLSPEVPNSIKNNIEPVINDWLKSQSLETHDIAHWVIHPGSASIIQAVQDSLKLPQSKVQHSLEILEEYGNMSSGTVFFILDSLTKSQKLISKDKIVMIAFGPGLTCEMALLVRS